MSDIQTVLGGDVNVVTQAGGDQQIQTTVADEAINVVSQVADVPQIQTTVSGDGVSVASVVNAPFIEVTSVNGMTGDVNIEAKAETFKARTMYEEGTLIVRDGKLFVAKKTFTSGNEYDADDWTEVRATTTRADWAETNENSESFIQNKPALADVATSGSYNDLGDKPALDLEAILTNGNKADKDVVLSSSISSNGLNVSDGNVNVSDGNMSISSDGQKYVDIGSGDDLIVSGEYDADGNKRAQETINDRIRREAIIYFDSLDDLKAFLKTDDVPRGWWTAAVSEDDSETITYNATCIINGNGTAGGGSVGAVDLNIKSRSVNSYGMVDGGPGVGDTTGYPWDTLTLKRTGNYHVDFNYVMKGDGASSSTIVGGISFETRRNGTRPYKSETFATSWNSGLNAVVATGSVDIDNVQAGDEFVPNYGYSNLASGNNLTMDGSQSYIILKRKEEF